MKITAEQPHFSYISSEARLSMPRNQSRDFEKGYESFLDFFYVGCLEQELHGLQDDLSTFIVFEQVFEFILNEIQESHAQYPFEGDLKEFWKGHMNAQRVIQDLCTLAYTPNFQVA